MCVLTTHSAYSVRTDGLSIPTGIFLVVGIAEIASPMIDTSLVCVTPNTRAECEQISAVLAEKHIRSKSDYV